MEHNYQDDFVELLTREAQSAISILHEFRLSQASGPGFIHVFFEGVDDKHFYLTEIRRRDRDLDVFPYVCDGKKSVVRVKHLIDQDGDEEKRCLFFIDRDHDDLVGGQPEAGQDLYITDYYSIESHISSVDSLEIVLVDLANIKKNSDKYEYIFNSYLFQFESFAHTMRSFMSWVLCMREAGNKLNLNNINLTNVFSFKDDGTVSRKEGAFQKFRRCVTVDNAEIDITRYRYWHNYLKNIEPKLWIRGKYDLWFFEKTLSCLIGRLRKEHKENPVQTGKIVVPACLKSNSSIEVICGKIEPPQSLANFLDVALAA